MPVGYYKPSPDAIETYTGKWFPLLTPTPGLVDIEDIAWSLSQQCRHVGHTLRFVSVAEHCCHVYDWLNAVERGYSGEICLAGLLHDAAEAYVGDISGPLKRLPELAGYRDIERAVQAVVWERFGIEEKHWRHPAIKLADEAVLLAEIYAAKSSHGNYCGGGNGSVTLRRHVSPGEAYGRFNARFAQQRGS